MMRISRLSFLLVLDVLSCSDRPSRERFPGTDGATVGFESQGSTRAVLGGFDRDAATVQRDDQKIAVKGGEAKVAGTLRVRGKIPEGTRVTLFLSLRSKSGGPPLAAKRLPVGTFPQKFELTEANAMIAGTTFDDEMLFVARIDGDGDPISRNPGDLEANATVKKNQSDITVELK